ncbi:MAG: sugar ABC transporter ATP-binding protein [Christensenellaceae bacterium]|nr:sugar ABC transporter ATP-binding protein [Christensenellaceae bacterium]
MQEVVLQLKDIRKEFYGVEVLHGVSLTFKKGEIHGLVGENGAGKSTLMNVIGGVFAPESGTMTLGGKPYNPVTPKDARASRIAFIHQELNLFSNLTVAENLYIDNLPKTRTGAVNFRFMNAQAKKKLGDLGVQISPRAVVESLPMGVRQTVEIIKALLMDAQIILFDEPTTSLSQKEKDFLFGIIRGLREKGVTVVYISHILEDVFSLCDVVSVLRDGSMIDDIEKKDLDRDRIVSLMVGRKLEKIYPSVQKQIGEPLFSVEHMYAPPAVQDVSLTLNEGEVLGIFGLMGAGRTEFVRALYGLDPMTSGEITFRGKRTKGMTPERWIAEGMAFISEDRRKEGLLMPKPVEDNLVLAKLSDMVRALGLIKKRDVASLADQIIRDFSIKVADKQLQLASNLSGGNQQKVVIGKWLARKPRMLIMDEPTRGVDVGAKYEIYTLMLELAKSGSGILCISSEMEELIGICDRILIMCNGKITGEVSRSEFAAQAIMEHALTGGQGHA